MASLNHIFLIGNLTRDPELRYTPSGTPVGGFGLAVNRKYNTKSGEKKEEVDFFEIEVWDKQAEVCSEYLSKGKSVLVQGRLKQDRWEDESGNKKSKLKIVASNVQFISQRMEEERQPEIPFEKNEEKKEPDLPF
ncbi:MAG: single-stranded DNA-binding protein [bacterium]